MGIVYKWVPSRLSRDRDFFYYQRLYGLSGSKKKSLIYIYILMNMKNKQEVNRLKVPTICIDPSLEIGQSENL